mgnify:CR=1 FL=1
MDTVALVDKYPNSDERVLAEQIVRSGGGPASVAAVTLARLGINSAIVGTIGDDEDGRLVLDIFKKDNPLQLPVIAPLIPLDVTAILTTSLSNSPDLIQISSAIFKQ